MSEKQQGLGGLGFFGKVFGGATRQSPPRDEESRLPKWTMGILNSDTVEVPGSVLLLAAHRNEPLGLRNVHARTSHSSISTGFTVDPTLTPAHGHPSHPGTELSHHDQHMDQQEHQRRRPSRTLENPEDKKKTEDGKIILDPQPEESANDPLNWPSWQRDLALLSLGFYCMLGGGMTPIIAAGFQNVADTFDIPIARVSLSTGLYMMGLGVGSIIFSPTAILYGKRPVYLGSSILFVGTSLWAAWAPNFASLLAARVFHGVAISPVECLPSATIAEIFFLHERAFRIGIYTLLLLSGKNLMPLVSAAIINSLSWRWTFWIFAMIVAFGGCLLFFFVPETFWDRTPTKKSHHQRPNFLRRLSSRPGHHTSRPATGTRTINVPTRPPTAGGDEQYPRVSTTAIEQTDSGRLHDGLSPDQSAGKDQEEDTALHAVTEASGHRSGQHRHVGFSEETRGAETLVISETESREPPKEPPQLDSAPAAANQLEEKSHITFTESSTPAASQPMPPTDPSTPAHGKIIDTASASALGQRPAPSHRESHDIQSLHSFPSRRGSAGHPATSLSHDGPHLELGTVSDSLHGPPVAEAYTQDLRQKHQLSFIQQLKPYHGRLNQDKWLKVMVRPLILFAYPAVLWSSAIYACSIGWLIVISETVSTIYQSRPYNFTPLQVGLVYVSPFVGGVLGTGVAGKISDVVVMALARRNGGLYEPEFRLVMVIPILITTCIGLMGFGWSAYEGDSWIVPTLFFGLVSFGCSLGSTTSITYCVDSYRQYSGEALVTLNFSKNVLHGLVFSLFVPSWLEHDGAKSVYVWLGIMQLIIVLSSIPMFIFGKRARMWTTRKNWIENL